MELLEQYSIQPPHGGDERGRERQRLLLLYIEIYPSINNLIWAWQPPMSPVAVDDFNMLPSNELVSYDRPFYLCLVLTK